jgi:hypothetical protein
MEARGLYAVGGEPLEIARENDATARRVAGEVIAGMRQS